jgi:hypothetical protein
MDGQAKELAIDILKSIILRFHMKDALFPSIFGERRQPRIFVPGD